MQRRFATGQMSKARPNKNVFSFDLKVFRLLHNWISGGWLFHTTGANILKERLAHTVIVLGTAIKERVNELRDILDAVTRLEMRLFKYAGIAVSRTFNLRTASLYSLDVRRAAGEVTAEGAPHDSLDYNEFAWVRLGNCSTTWANEFCIRCSLVIELLGIISILMNDDWLHGSWWGRRQVKRRWRTAVVPFERLKSIPSVLTYTNQHLFKEILERT